MGCHDPNPWCRYAFGVAWTQKGEVLLSPGVVLDDPESWCRLSSCRIFIIGQRSDDFCGSIIRCHWHDYQSKGGPSK